MKPFLTFEFLVFYVISIWAILILSGQPSASSTQLFEVTKILTSGYLGYKMQDQDTNKEDK